MLEGGNLSHGMVVTKQQDKDFHYSVKSRKLAASRTVKSALISIISRCK